MLEINEYETPINSMKRLTQKDDSEEFDIKVRFSKDETKEIRIRTTLNKARVISNKINQTYQIDPTITQYELIIPAILSKSSKDKIEDQLRTISANIELILKSTTEKVNINKSQKHQINIIRRLLGEFIDDDETISTASINDAISFLSTEFHPESIKYLAKHMNDIIDANEISNLDKEIIKEIIDCYFNDKTNKDNSEQTKTQEEEEKELFEYEELFEKLKIYEEPEIVFHFLLQIETHNYTKDMREYINDNLSDDIISTELNLIIKRFVSQINSETNKEETKTPSIKATNIEYTNDELNGIISHLKTKYGENLIEQGIIKINDKGNFQHSTGSLSNLIKYDTQCINDYYRNNAGCDPLPNSTEGWIEFDFMERKINLTSYTLRNYSAYNQKSWRILGSNDRNEWEIIDQKTNDASLKSNYTQHRFECENKRKYFQYIRYIQDDSWRSDRKHNIWLSCVEFFGSISDN